MHIRKLILSFLKVGAIGFGGGSALIPVIQREIVEKSGAITEEEYLKHTVVANITPGALPVKLGATCGFALKGAAGGFFSAYAVTLPGALATVLILALFSFTGPGAITLLNYASIGITAFIVFLLVNYIVRTVRGERFKINFVVFLAAFLLTGGREVREIIEAVFHLPEHTLGVPLFNISMIDLMIIAFFLILFYQYVGKNARLLFGGALALLYAIFSGGAVKGFAWAGVCKVALGVVFVALIVFLALKKRTRAGKRAGLRLRRRTLVAIGCFLAVPLASLCLFLVPAFRGGESLAFLGNVLVSTVTSFGGGEAYVAVADSVFVQGGFIAPEVYYGQIVPIANALPGPILVKLCAAMGFSYGSAMATPLVGGLLAFQSAAVAVGACSAIALVVLDLYDALKDSAFIGNLKRYILPVICGSLLSTSLAMMVEAMKITVERGFYNGLVFVVLCVGVAVMYWLHKRFALNDLIMLGASIVLSLGVMLAFG